MITHEFTLSNPIKIHLAGSEQPAALLELTAPSVKNRKSVAKLKQGFMRSIGEIPNKPEDKKDAKAGEHEIKPKEVLAIIQMGSMEYDDYMDIFINLLTSGVCRIEDKEQLTSPMAEKISFEDMERLMGEYLVNFILGSLGE